LLNIEKTHQLTRTSRFRTARFRCRFPAAATAAAAGVTSNGNKLAAALCLLAPATAGGDNYRAAALKLTILAAISD